MEETSLPKRTPNPTAVLFGFSFLSAATYVLTRTLGVSLFMARIGSDALPLALGASAVCVIALSTLTRLVVRFVPTGYCVTLSWLTLAAASFLLSIKIVALPHSLMVVGAIYVLAEVRGCLNTVYVTTLANDLFASSRSKNPFVIVAAGAPVAGIISGLIVSYEAAEISDTTWLSVIACLDLLTMAVSCFLPRPSRDATTKQKQSRLDEAEYDGELRVASNQTNSSDEDRSSPKDSRRLTKNWRRYRFGLASLVGIKVVVLTLVGFQWQIVVNDSLVSEQRMIAYFAAFYAINDVLIVLIQAVASGKLLDRYGIGAPLILYPILLSLIGIAALLADSLTVLMVVFTVGCGLNVLRRSLHDPGLAAAYAILDPSVRSETIVLVKGMIKPFSEVAAAMGLLFYASDISSNALTLVWVILLLPWYMIAKWVARRYSTVRGAAGERLLDETN